MSETNYKDELDEAITDGDVVKFREHFEPSDLDSEEYMGTLMHFAARYGTVDIVRFLVENGASLDRRGGVLEAPPISYAARSGNLDILRYLLEAGATLDTRHATINPLLGAARQGHVEVVEYLLQTSIDPHATYRTLGGALINSLTEAMGGGNKEIVNLLQARGCHKPVEGVDIPLWEPPKP